MSEDAEFYGNLVLGFRMTELCNLMNFAGKCRTGRKTELQERALELVQLNSPDINLKIKELSNGMNQNLGQPASFSSSLGSISGRMSSSSSVSYSNPYNSPIPDSPPAAAATSAANAASYSLLPTYPDVALRRLPFFDIESTLLKPCSLQPNCNARFQEQNFTFHLTPQQASAISNSSYRNELGRPEYRKQIQMRFSLLETSCDQEDNFPSSICVKINGRVCPLPTPIPTNKPGAEPKRPPRPINITNMCKLCATSPNYINVSWAVESGKAHTVSVYLVENLTYQDLLNRLKQKGERNPDFTKALIKEKLKDQDQEIATTSCKVTLACPLGKMRMNLPCRATTCDHLQCFDAALYLMMNEKKPKWVCPVCNKPALNDNLMVDGFFLQLVKSSRLPPDEHEIVLHNDGTWDPLPPKKEEIAPLLPAAAATRPPAAAAAAAFRAAEAPVSIDDSDSEGATGGSSSFYSPAPGPPPPARPFLKRPLATDDEEVDCITLDSDSEDDAGHESKQLKLSSPVPLSSSSSPNQPPGSPELICLDDD